MIQPHPVRRSLLRPAIAMAAGLATVTGACAQSERSIADYPTADRVVFVQACMRDNPNGGHYEMVNKCSCALDTIARQVPYEEFTTMETATNANSIGGERGSYIRDTDELQKLIRKYRTIKADAFKACFVTTVSPR
jgi:hypothetical protein